MIQKTPVHVNFAAGLDTKTDPNQVPVGKFLNLVNSIFDVTGRLTKRNGFGNLPSLPNDNQTVVTTLNDNLIATGTNLSALSADSMQWLPQGIVRPVGLEVQPLVRVSTSQSAPDTAVTADGLTLLVYMDNNVSYYQISDSNTGQQIVQRTSLGSTSTNPRAFLLGRYFIATFTQTVSATSHLRYIAIPIATPSAPLAAKDISTTILSLTTGYDGVIANNSLYLSWAGSATTIRTSFLTSTLVSSSEVVTSGHTATLMSVTADNSASTPVIWCSYWDSTSTNAFTMAFDQQLNAILAPTSILTAVQLTEITSVATDKLLTVMVETLNNYNSVGAYPTANIRTDFVSRVTCTQAGVASSPTVVLRSVGLASKAFIGTDGTIYALMTYGPTTSPTLSNQPTYLLSDSLGNIYLKLAYSNGGGYQSTQVLPSVTLVGTQYYFPYMITDFLAAVNKTTAEPTGTQINAIYTQKGVNLAKITLDSADQYSAEIAGALHLTGGQLWEYDGVRPVEHGFDVWPENIAFTTATTGGLITAQQYFYVFTYEWTDNQGNLHRSAPSIPLALTTTGSTSANTLYVPTLRLTAKLSPNPVRIVGYRWSTAQQNYYQFTSLTSPTVNDTTVDYVTIIDTFSDTTILGNTLLYTTGGVVENIGAPASIASAMFKNRLFLVTAEDPNLVQYSKQVIQSVPVEFSDLFTLYVAPSSGAQGSTGKTTAISAMDDKLIIFKRDAIYYVTGQGPDNTGAQDDFSDPIFITASVGCTNPKSIVLMPNGLMFQSDKGIWLLDRGLNTVYIGQGVERYNDQTIQSATAIPGTNQVRFILSSGITLVFDYFQETWGTFSNISASSATLYQGLHTYLNKFGQVFQETPGKYTDGSTPVLMSFTTSWLNVAGIRGYERFYDMLLLGTYVTPFKLQVLYAFDYNQNPAQSVMVTPDNYTPAWGGDANWGANVGWGGPGNVFQARVSPARQKCQTFQVTVNEIYDPSFGVAAGEGLTLSGMNLIVGVKSGYSPQKAKRSFG